MRFLRAAAIIGLGGLALWSVGKKTWGPDLLGDPMYRSGRDSVCKPPSLSGDPIALRTQDLGRRARLAGYEHGWAYEFDAGKLEGGTIDLCSEYGSVVVLGVDSARGRIVTTLSDPFPGGDSAILDTHLRTLVRADGGGLRVAVWQQTQGMTTFRSMTQKGARPVAVNLVLELPRAGVYRLGLVANHQRLSVKGLDVHGLLEGYLSPGAELDVGLAGALTLRLNNGDLKADWRREAGIDFRGGTTARFRPRASTHVEAILERGDAVIDFAGSDAGLDVIARAPEGTVIVDLGPTEAHRVDTTGTYARTLAFAGAARKVELRVTTKGGQVVIRR